MLVYAPRWSLASQFWSYPPPQKLVFPRPKKSKMKIPHWKRMRGPLLKKESQRPPKQIFFFGCFCQRFCRADVDSRAQQAILLKKWKKSCQNKIAFFLFFRRKIGTILSHRSRLSRTSRAPSRLSRTRPMDCDAGPKRTVNISRVLANSFFEHRQFVSHKVRHLVTIYTPKEAHSLIFVAGGSFSRDKCWPRKKLVSARRACTSVQAPKLAAPRKSFYLATFFSI